MPTWSQNVKQFFTSNAGKPLVGGKLYTYAAGTTTPKNAFKDAAFTIPHTNPVILDSRGEELIYWSGLYKVVLKYQSGKTIWTVNNVAGTGLVLSTPDTVELPPVANFTYSPIPTTAPATIATTNTSTLLTGSDAYMWLLDGALLSVDFSPQFYMATPGAHVLRLTVSNEFGEDSFEQYIVLTDAVLQVPVVTDIVHNALPPISTGTLITFSEQHSGSGVSSWSWVFKIDGAIFATSPLTSPTINASLAGLLRAEVTVTNAAGTSAVYGEDIGTVVPPGSSTYVAADYVAADYVV